jgi:hypothetical protein
LKYTDPNGYWAGWDDLIVGGIGFGFGYVSHGLSTGDWGWSAVGQGALSAGMFLMGYYSGGISSAGSIASAYSSAGLQGVANKMALSFAGKYALSSTVNSMIPGMSIPITNDISVSMSMGLGVSASGFVGGGHFNVTYSRNDWVASVGFGAGDGSTGSYSGWGASARFNDWGVGYNRTTYSGPHSQVVGGATLFLGKDVAFRLENDFFGDRNDRWRSNAFELSVGWFVLGSNLYNNEVDVTAKPDLEGGMLLNNSCNRSPYGAWRDGQTYSSPLWVGFKANGQVYRFGQSHKWFGPGRTNFFNKYDYFNYGGFNYYGYNNPYSLW